MKLPNAGDFNPVLSSFRGRGTLLDTFCPLETVFGASNTINVALLKPAKLLKEEGMSNQNTGTTTTSAAARAHAWDEELIFDALRESVRRQLLLSMAKNSFLPASEHHLSRPGGRLDKSAHGKVDYVLKHLAVMRKAGLVIQKENPRDGRRALYGLSPNVPVTVTEEFVIVDFGFIMFRIRNEQNTKS